METLNLNKQSIREDFSSCQTLESLIQSIEERLLEKEKVVCKIVVNGLLLNEEDEKRLAQTRLHEVDFVEVEYRDKKELVEDSARDLNEWIIQFKTVLLQQAEKLRATSQITPYDFSQTVKNLFWLIGAIQAIKAHRATQHNWENVEKFMSTAVKELELAYQQQDLVLLADVIEYELTSGLDQWRVLLDSISGSSAK